MQLLSLVRYLYSALFYLLMPVIVLRLLLRSRNNPAYRQRIAERFGFSPFDLEKALWVHAVSVGEALVAISLIKKLQRVYPQLPIVVTTMTPTGAARIDAAFGKQVFHTYIPYDVPDAIARFLQRAQPLIAIIIETELWPNLLAACQKRKLPIMIANARLSQRSFKGYQRIAWISKKMLAAVTLLAAQSQEDAQRFIRLGMNPAKVTVTGNIKFDLELPSDLSMQAADFKQQLGPERAIWVAASTHAGEEELILKAHRLILSKHPQALVIIVPRHPERFTPVAELIAEQGFQMVRRSANAACTKTTTVYLADTMGEMFLFYAVADVALVAGSFVAVGGHNLLEPAALAKPVLSGPMLFNFKDISHLLLQARGLTIVNDAESIASTVLELFANKAQRWQQGQRALQVIQANRGALAKHVELVAQTLASSLFRKV